MDSEQGLAQGQDSQKSSSGLTTQPVQEAPVTRSDERVFRQSEVNDLVGRARREGAESASKRVQAEYQPTNQESEIRRMAAEEAQRLRDQWVSEAQTKAEADHAQRIVQNFWDKVNPGKEKYEDFEKVTGDIEYARFPNVVQLLADHIDNSHDVLYELGKNRLNLSQLEQLSYMSPKDAIVHIKRLSQSIKDNESASKVRTPNAPLSQLRPSSVGTDSGAMSVRDYRNKYKG